MKYHVYVHEGDDDHAYGVTFPDFPGCFAAADDAERLEKAIQEAVEVHFEGEDVAIPRPTPFKLLLRDRQYEGGSWLFVDIDLNKINVKSERVNVSMPTNLLRSIDDYAKEHHMSRSAFIQMAAREVMEQD